MTLRDKCRGTVTENDTGMDTVPRWQLQRMDGIKTRTWRPLGGRGGERQRRSAAAAAVRTDTCTRHTTVTGTLRQPGIRDANTVVGMRRSLGRPAVPLAHHRIRNMKSNCSSRMSAGLSCKRSVAPKQSWAAAELTATEFTKKLRIEG